MTLVTFRTKEEADYFNSVSGSNIWVGVDYIMTEGYLVQEDGVKVPELPWYKDTPDNFNGEEYCVQSGYYSAFNDVNCKDKMKFACQSKETILNPSPSTVTPVETINYPVVKAYFNNIGSVGE
jgi:Lectin C-type domain